MKARPRLTGFVLALLVCCPGQTGRGDADAQVAAVHDFTGVDHQIDPYLEHYRDPAFPYDPRDLRGRFSYQPGQAYDLYGACDMVYLLWTIGELEERTTEEGRREWVGLIQSWQDPETGWFDRGNETLHFRAHATAFATGALALLGAKPLHPFNWARPIMAGEDATGKWLESIWWDLVWVGSHQGGGIAASLQMTGEAPDQWYEWYFDWLGREANPDTGLWQRAWFNHFTKKPNMHDLGGAAHFWWIYQARNRPLPYPEKVVDSVLALQLESGLWDKKLIKGDFPYCINCDAVNGIKLAYLQLQGAGRDYRREDVNRSFDRYLRRCQQVLNDPGAIARLYSDNSHDLPGAFIGIAEADGYFQATGQGSRLKTTRPWRSVLDVICWL